MRARSICVAADWLAAATVGSAAGGAAVYTSDRAKGHGDAGQSQTAAAEARRPLDGLPEPP